MPYVAPTSVSTGDVLTAARYNQDVVENMSALAPAVNALTYDNMLYVRDEQTNNTQGGTFTSGAWTARVLNTVVTNTITDASLASNRITLPAGTYYVEGYAPALNCDNHRALWYNYTDSANVILGSSGAYSSAAGNVGDIAVVRGVFTIAASKAFELRHRCATTRATNGLGAAANFGVNEVYAEVLVFKV